jgi:hypothetical protein
MICEPAIAEVTGRLATSNIPVIADELKFAKTTNDVYDLKLSVDSSYNTLSKSQRFSYSSSFLTSSSTKA